MILSEDIEYNYTKFLGRILSGKNKGKHIALTLSQIYNTIIINKSVHVKKTTILYEERRKIWNNQEKILHI